jgi:hypothetical protein
MSHSKNRFFIDWSGKRAEIARGRRRSSRRISRKDLALLAVSRYDSDPPPQGTSLDVSYGLYRPMQEAS